ncbi:MULTISPECIES: D-alanine--D-alanine ligase family protein [Streptomyces]|uniref:D-alanine--D-alanine ligase n=1 Tax=Streptomyces dengpaensis TaxID=2049881 RepID=A0ABM6T3J4_9ACTN|nr:MULTISPECIES: D-alanine--D-alanine ligase [Streptomyces]AVH61703.1 D-alanine--D-alanine ligase [Streptomyces dengpaensis]PIB05089.1 D-alanine--D-alanine ligase [Streptomyces sp. HG99]
MSDLNVIVIAGGLSPEREVSLRSGARVADALRRAGVEVELRDVGKDLLPALAQDPPGVVFPVLHGIAGEDGTIKEVLELAGVPYVGARPQACRTAFDKTTAKAILEQAGLKTPESVTLPKQAFHDLGAAALTAQVVEWLGLELFVKPRACGSAFGVSRVELAEDLPQALMACFAYHDEALIERRVTGTEIAVAVADLGDGPRALPVVEIVADGLYDYTARYTPGAVEFHCPARLSAEVAQEAARVAVAAHEALGLLDLSRTDAIVTEDGEVFVLETNVAPGMTETSTYPMALAEAGLDFGGFCRDLAAQAAMRNGLSA